MVHPNEVCRYTGSHYLGKLHPELDSQNESGNKVRPGLVLRTGAHQGSLGTRLALGLYSTLGSLGEPGNEASPGRVLCTGAHQGSQEMRLTMSMHSLLVLTRRVWEQG